MQDLISDYRGDTVVSVHFLEAKVKAYDVLLCWAVCSDEGLYLTEVQEAEFQRCSPRFPPLVIQSNTNLYITGRHFADGIKVTNHLALKYRDYPE